MHDERQGGKVVVGGVVGGGWACEWLAGNGMWWWVGVVDN